MSSCLASQVVLDTGTRSRIPRIPGLRDVDFLTAGTGSTGRRSPTTSPSSEVATRASRWRSSTGAWGAASRSSSPGRDRDPRGREVARALRLFLESEDIAFRLKRGWSGSKRAGDGVRMALKTKRARDFLTVSHVFVATGRQPNTDDLGLETIGLETAKDGTIPVTTRLATKVRGVWAAGDIRGGAMFTHTAWDDFRVLASQLAGDRSRTTRRIVPYAIYTDPQLGRVGMTAAEARRAGRSVKVGRFELRKNGKAREIGETEGFIQVVADARSDRILGAAVLAHEGAELVHLFVDVMNARGRSAAIRDAIHIHPTLAEAVQSAVAALA